MKNSQHTRPWAKRLFFYLAAILLALMVAELAAVAAFLVATGRLYYLAPPRAEGPPLTLESTVGDYRIHPYFGFSRVARSTKEPGGPRINNYGFFSPVDYPYPRSHPDELIVAVFGGSSVAEQIVLHELQTQILKNELLSIYDAAMPGVTVLNLAAPGYKQPQQLLLMAYLISLGQTFDIAVNFDGFNEVVLSSLNIEAGVAAAMPSIEHMRALQDVTSITADSESLSTLLRVRRSWQKYAESFNHAWSGRSWELQLALGFSYHYMIYKFHHYRYLQQRSKYAQGDVENAGSWLNLQGSTEAEDSLDPTRLVEDWARSSRLMRQMSEQIGADYFHFVQPNQYYATKRKFTPKERQLAFHPSSPYSRLVQSGFPLLGEASIRLQSENIAVFPMFEIFDDITETVYADNCCHFNEYGLTLILEEIARQVVKRQADSPVASESAGQ